MEERLERLVESYVGESLGREVIGFLKKNQDWDNRLKDTSDIGKSKSLINDNAFLETMGIKDGELKNLDTMFPHLIGPILSIDDFKERKEMKPKPPTLNQWSEKILFDIRGAATVLRYALSEEEKGTIRPIIGRAYIDMISLGRDDLLTLLMSYYRIWGADPRDVLFRDIHGFPAPKVILEPRRLESFCPGNAGWTVLTLGQDKKGISTTVYSNKGVPVIPRNVLPVITIEAYKSLKSGE